MELWDRVIFSVENGLTGSKEARTWEEGSVMGAGVGVWRRGEVGLGPGAGSWPPGYGACLEWSRSTDRSPLVMFDQRTETIVGTSRKLIYEETQDD